PDLRSRVPLHMGQGDRLSVRKLGEQIGEEGHVLSLSEMPKHTHVPACNSSTNSPSQSPVDSVWAVDFAGVFTGYAPPPDSIMLETAIAPTGASVPHENRQPYLVLNAIIALSGIYPSRN